MANYMTSTTRLKSTCGRGSEGGESEACGYQRTRDLPRLIPMLATDLDTPTIEAHQKLVRLLRRALRLERNRGRAAHWSYDLGRHAGLVNAYCCECLSLRVRMNRARSLEAGDCGSSVRPLLGSP